MTDSFDAAITAADRAPVWSLRADWDRDGYQHPLADLSDLVDSLTVTRELAGGLPPEVGLVEGYAAASLTATLSGTWIEQQVEALPDPQRNLCPVPAPSVSAVDWRYDGTPPARSTGPGPVPVTGMARGWAFRLVATNPGTVPPHVMSARTANVVDEGQQWSGTVQWRCTRASPNVLVSLIFYSPGGGYVGQVSVGAGAHGAGEVVTFVVTGTAPEGAACVDIGVTVYGLTDGTNATLDVTAARLDQVADPALPFFDGDSPGWEWDGPAGLSTAAAASTLLTPDHDVATVLSAYREDSPLTRANRPLIQVPLVCDTGMATEDGERFTRRFTGQVSSINPASSSREVRLGGLDGANRLRAKITLPGVAIDGLLLAKYGPDLYRSRINSQWIIDYVLRRNGIYASPPARPDAVLSVTMHGSVIPEVGFGGVPQEYFPQYRGSVWDLDGPFGMLCPMQAGMYGSWGLAEPITMAPGAGIGFSAVVELGGTAGSGMTQTHIAIEVSSDQSVLWIFGVNSIGRPFAGMQVNGPGGGTVYATDIDPAVWPTPTTRTFTFIGVHVAFSETTMTCTWRAGGVTYTRAIAVPLRSNPWNPEPKVQYNLVNRITNIQLWNDPRPPTEWVGETHTPQARIDPGTNELTGIPEIVAGDSLDIVKDVVTAELATFGFDEDGVAEFRSRYGDQLRGPSPVTEDITAETNLSDLVATTDEASIRNSITVKTATLLLDDWADVVTAQTYDEFDSAPGTNIFRLAIDSSVYQLPFRDDYQYAAPGNWDAFVKDPDHRHQIRMFAVKRDDPFTLVSANIKLRTVRVSPWQILLVVVNSNPFWVRFATQWETNTTTGGYTEGTPALAIPARAVVAGDEQATTFTDQGSIDTYGESTYDLDGSSVWRQWPGAMSDVAAGVLAQTAHPTPVLDAFDVPHDPRRAIGQRIRVVDPDGLGSVLCRIVGLTTTLTPDQGSGSSAALPGIGGSTGGGGATDTITVRPLAPPGMGLLDDLELGLCDTTLILAP